MTVLVSFGLSFYLFVVAVAVAAAAVAAAVSIVLFYPAFRREIICRRIFYVFFLLFIHIASS